jgi:hypothetical protein
MVQMEAIDKNAILSTHRRKYFLVSCNHQGSLRQIWTRMGLARVGSNGRLVWLISQNRLFESSLNRYARFLCVELYTYHM